MLDAPETMFSIAFMYLGLDPNSQRPEDREAAEALLTRVRPYVRYFHSSQYVNDLASGEVCVSIGWSGGVMQARSRGAQAETPVEVAYVIRKEGASLWMDGMAIPADAPHPDNAHAFIDYVMEPKVMAEISDTIGQANANAASVPFVSEALRNDPAIYPSPEVSQRLHLEMDWDPQTVRDINRAWTRIRTGQ
jgi:putrescine transport system substrate-binding protein